MIEKKKKNNKNISYTEKLLAGNINKIIQKVGEEAVEVLIEATLQKISKKLFMKVQI